MIARPSRWIVSAILLFPVAGIALAAAPALVLAGPTPTAQLGVPYNSALVASGGTGFYSYSISSGSLPPGLILTGNTGAIRGTPTTAGTFNFSGSVADFVDDPVRPPIGAGSAAAARRRTTLQSGNPSASVSSAFTITVSAPPAAAGVPTSMWTLCLMMTCLAGAGFFRLRQQRRA
jgi:hypothetical protein